nr:MAG: putative polyprotein [StochSlu_7 virus]
MTAYYLYRQFSSDEPKVSKNTTDDEDNATYHKIIDRYQRGFAQGIEHDVMKRDLIAEYGVDNFRQAEWIMRNSNVTAQELIDAGDWKGLQLYWKKNPNDVPTAVANQITQDMITFQSDSQIETLATLLEVNTILLTNKTTAGKNFGLGIFGPYLISVAHAVEKDMDACYIINNGVQHAVTCIWLDRSRDLAIYKLVTNTFAFKDIRHHFGTKDLFDKTKEGYFVRSIHKNRTIAACAIRYTAKRTVPLSDGNEYFKPDTGLYTTLFATTDRPIFLKRGDCGLPLVVRTDSGLRIVGVHNAITLSNMAFFTSVSIEDFDQLQTVQSNAAVFHFHKPKQQFTTHEWYQKVMDSDKKSARVPRCGLTVLGYSSEAHLPSFPKDSHREMLDAQVRHDLKEPLPTKPSALKFKPEIMSPDKLIKDNKGIPHTLWTQSVKYTYKDPLYQQWDPVVKQITMDLIKQRYKRDYEPAKFMNLALNINGDGTTNNKPWDMTTSGGPLLKKLYNIHTKEDLFINKAKPDSRPFYVFADTPAAKHVREMYETYTASLESGTPISIWCKDNRKVELLPADKVHEGKVRLFNEMDFSVNMVLKKYFGHVLTDMLKNHVDGPYKIGMDVYSEATIYYRKMSKIVGNLLSTDISGCDKTMPAEIIEGFCETMCQGYDEKLIKALAQSLTYTIHIMDGIIYLVDKGNESGSYVTTSLNCYGMEVITIYPVVEKLIELKIAPTLNNVEEVLSAVYYGDDRSMKIAKELNMNINDLIRCGAYFNFKVTPAKVQSEYISFCSREFIPDEDGVVYPKLKKTSVLSCLFWVKKRETKYIQANINVALFEASLHEKEFFIRVVTIVNAILIEYPSVAPYIQIYEYDTYRKVFKDFVYNWRDGPILLKTGETEVSSDVSQNLEQLQISQNNYNKTQLIMDYVSRINNMSQVKGKEPKYEFIRTGPQESPMWTCTAIFDNQKATAQAKTKKLAQQEAAKQIVLPNNDTGAKLVLNMQDCDDLYTNELFFKPYATSVGFATINSSKLSVNLDQDFSLDELREDLEDNNFMITKCNLIKIFVNGNLIHKQQILIEKMVIRQNNDQAVEPAVMNQAAMGAQRANLPSQTNPQPTAVMPAMTHTGDDIMGAVTTALPETLNPIGAPDMLAVGAITFDIKDLIYQQFLDCDTQLVVSDDAVEGSIIAQIPYGLQSPYINSYIKYYAKAHERFNGSIQFRFTVIGNPLFSGAIGIAWYPKKIATTTLPISELMKYSYQAEGVTTPWNKVHVLHDARREHFYRLVEDEVSDYDNRPHLVIFLMMSLQNPLREGVQTRIRIASKLANSAEPNPFTFSNPDILTVTPSLAVSVPGLTTTQGSNVPSVFPHTLNIDSNIFTDGNMAAPQVFDFGIPHRNLILNGPINGARVTRKISDSTPSGSYFQFKSNQKYRTYSNNVSELGMATLYNISNVPRQQYNMFANALGEIPMADRSLTLFPAPGNYTGRDPDAFRSLLINFINTFNEGYLSRRFGIVALYYSSPDDTDPFRFGLFKIITTHGVIILAIQIVPTTPIADTTSPGIIDQWGALSYNQIDIPYNINTVAGNLPSDYSILRISDQPVSAIVANTLTNPTATDDPSISMYYKRLSSDIDITQCYQFEIQDPVSFRTVATVRYLQEFGIFVVRGANMYMFFPQKFSTLVLTTPVLVNRTNGFPITDTNYWSARTSTTFVETKRFLHAAEYPVTVQRNSAIAGGMLSGLGAGLGQKSKNKHELAMQGNQLTHEKDMQESDQTYGLKYQKRGFLGQAGLAGINYKSNSALSKQDYTQKQGLAAQQQEFAKENQNREMLLSGARAPVSGATTAVSHA